MALHERVLDSPAYTEEGVAARVTVGLVTAFPVPDCDVAPTLTVANPVPVAVLQVSV